MAMGGMPMGGMPMRGGGAAPMPAAMPAPSSNGSAPVNLRLYVEGIPATYLGPVVGVLGARAATLSNVKIGEPSLEDVFIHLTGRSLR